jgi:C1A family cysteine protease
MRPYHEVIMRVRQLLVLAFAVVFGYAAFCQICASAQVRAPKTVKKPAKTRVKQAQLQKATPALARIDYKKLKVSAALTKAIKKKSRFNPKQIEKALTYSHGIPILKLKSGKNVQLESIQAEPAVPASARVLAPALTKALTKYTKYISAQYIGPGSFTTILPRGVDHRSTQTAIRDQGGRGTCVAFAAVAAIEAIYKRNHGQTRDLSENHAHNVFMAQEGSTCMADIGLQTWKAANYLKLNKICLESQSPYIYTTSSVCSVIPLDCMAHRVHGPVAFSTFFAPAFGGSGNNIATNTNYLESLIDAGYDPVLGVYVAGGDWFDGTAETGVVDVEINSNGSPAGPYGGHAMPLVGYNQTENYFIFKNSWGTAVGHNGYFYVSYEYLQTYAKYGYVVLAATNP